MTDQLSSQAAAVAKAVTGDGTPEQATATSKPDRIMTIAMAGAGPVISVLLGFAIYVLGWSPWPDVVAPGRVDAIKWVALALCGCLVVVTLRLASGQFKHADIKAGPASLTIGSE